MIYDSDVGVPVFSKLKLGCRLYTVEFVGDQVNESTPQVEKLACN